MIQHQAKMKKILVSLALAIAPCVLVGWFYKEVWAVCTRPLASLTVLEAVIILCLLSYPFRKFMHWLDRLDGK